MNNIIRKCYTMAQVEGEIEITMYGEICEKQPRDWWTDEPIDGTYILQDEFLKDLDTITSSGAKKLKIRMNSVGGDAGVSILIHNRLRELAADGVELTCIVDGVAMSGGSLIMCACDHVVVNPSSIVMIHKCWSMIWGGYNADELRALAKQNDAWDDAQIAIYAKKCGLSDTVISHMMSETTYMIGKEALDKGFADELTEDGGVGIAASADRKSLFVHGRKIHLAKGMTIPDSIPTVSTAEAEEINNNTPGSDTGSEGGANMATNLEELRAENAELAATVESEVRAALSAENASAIDQAAAAERKRLAEIDEIANLYDNDTVRQAKYGDHPCTAAEMAFNAAKEAAKKGTAFMSNVKTDYDASGADKVGAAQDPEAEKGNETDVKASAKAAVEKFKQMKGVK